MDVTTFRAGKRTGDPNRPKLNDFLIFWLLQDSELLSGAEHLDRGWVPNVGEHPTTILFILRCLPDIFRA